MHSGKTCEPLLLLSAYSHQLMRMRLLSILLHSHSGDRISWTGDAHLAQKAALVAFGGDHGTRMVRDNTVRTQGVDNGIISYDMYFVLSVR